ncbi:DUF2285 domain-containing protein [Komagataeibacter melaceti]|nr:DUF2285 domain-containing protein [Komagataeibacter melaceti]
MKPRPSPGTGGCDFDPADHAEVPSSAVWTARAFPGVTVLTTMPVDLTDDRLGFRSTLPEATQAVGNTETVIHLAGTTLHVLALAPESNGRAVLLPFDRLFEIRIAAALRLWRAAMGQRAGRDPTILSPARRERLILALRFLDGSGAGASRREMAPVLFRREAVSARDWIGHDLQARMDRLARLANSMRQRNYRRLLLHPFRERI